MQNIAKFVNTAVTDYLVDSSKIQWIQARIGCVMKPNGWVLLVMSNRECIVLQFNHGSLTNQGYVVNDEKVLKVFGNHQIGDISYDEQSIVVEGIVDLDHGSRFEGLVLTEKEGKIGIPFGYGEMYDDDGLLLYKGIMINWKRFGYGTSYHDNGMKEYEGYWCDDNRFGSGKVYDLSGNFVKECLWYNGIESDIEDYEGDGSEPMNIGMKHLKLTNNCVLVDWDVSLFLNLESIETGNDCFVPIRKFKIDGLNRLKTLKIGDRCFFKSIYYDIQNTCLKFYILNCVSLRLIEIGCNCFPGVQTFIIDGLSSLETLIIGSNSFTHLIGAAEYKYMKSFYILNCESLKSIQIGENSFSDFGGEFELQNLPQLQSIQIGTIGSNSCNFTGCSCVIQGFDMMLCNE